MKITCDACGAKYSIADEKVAGKAFKIKCKKCSSAIVVRAEQPAAPASDKSSTEAKWHVVVAGEQQGPLSTEKVGELIASGAIDWDAYVWQEGYEDWKSARDVPELVNALQASDADTEHAVPASSVGGAGSSESADDEEPTRAQNAHDIHEMLSPAAQPKLSRASAAAGADLFAQSHKEEVHLPSESPFSGSAFSAGLGDSVGAPGSAKAHPQEVSSENLTGSRNETSVLFSLSNLKQLKTSTPPNKQASGLGAGSVPAGAATDDASGLIDIRALAAAASSTGSSSANKGQQKDSDLAESILQSHQGTVPLAPLAAPSLRPETSGPNQRMLMVGFGVVGLLALVAIGLLVVFLTQKPQPASTVATAPAPVGTSPAQVPSQTGSGTPAPGQVQAPGTPENTAEKPSTEDTSDKTARESASKERSSSRRSSSGSRTTPEPEPPKKSTGSIDDLLDQAIGTPGGSKTPGSSASNLPDAPSRSDVTSAMRSVQSNVQSCGQGKTGVAQVSVSVSGSSGRVSSAQVGGAFAGTPAGRCIANAVKGARFPKFKRSSFTFVYPFRL